MALGNCSMRCPRLWLPASPYLVHPWTRTSSTAVPDAVLPPPSMESCRFSDAQHFGLICFLGVRQTGRLAAGARLSGKRGGFGTRGSFVQVIEYLLDDHSVKSRNLLPRPQRKSVHIIFPQPQSRQHVARIAHQIRIEITFTMICDLCMRSHNFN